MRIPRDCYWFDDEDRRQRLYEYCRKDVGVERELYQQLRSLPPEEQELWLLDLRINARGFHIDRDLAAAARAVAHAATPELNAELAQLTGSAVTSINQVARLKVWLAQQGCITDTLDKIKELRDCWWQTICRPQHGAYWNSARAVPRLPPRKLMPCSPVVTAMAAFAAPCATTVLAQADGLAMGCSPKT